METNLDAIIVPMATVDATGTSGRGDGSSSGGFGKPKP